MASCTGLSVLLCNAFRSVGIPARISGTASWTTKPGNHNWVELYDPETKSWHFTEYYPDAKGIDHGWFIADAAKAIPGHPLKAIYASSWKATGLHVPLVWAPNNITVPALDVTHRYIGYGESAISPNPHQCELRIDWKNTAGQRVALASKVIVDKKIIAQGSTPGPTADLNSYFTVHVPRGAIYEVTFDGQKHSVVDVTEDAEILRVEGNATPTNP